MTEKLLNLVFKPGGLLSRQVTAAVMNSIVDAINRIRPIAGNGLVATPTPNGTLLSASGGGSGSGSESDASGTALNQSLLQAFAAVEDPVEGSEDESDTEQLRIPTLREDGSLSFIIVRFRKLKVCVGNEEKELRFVTNVQAF